MISNHKCRVGGGDVLVMKISNAAKTVLSACSETSDQPLKTTGDQWPL